MYAKIILVGNLGKDPEMKYTTGGDPVATFSVATSGFKDETAWWRVRVWGKQAELCNQYLHKGSKVLIEGALKPGPDGNPRVYERKDGTWGASFDVTASAVTFFIGNDDDTLANDEVPF